jgi:hypothetical protein
MADHGYYDASQRDDNQRDAYAALQSHLSLVPSQAGPPTQVYSLHDRPVSSVSRDGLGLERNPSNAQSLSPFDSVSNVGSAVETPVQQYGSASYLQRDPYARDLYAQDRGYGSQSNLPTPFASSHYLPEHAQQEDSDAHPLVQYAAGPGFEKRSSVGPNDTNRYDAPDEEPATSYPPMDAEKRPVSDGKRPSVWLRQLRDTTPLEQRIENHRRGIGVQRRPWVCWVLSAAMVIAMLAEFGQNWRYQGTPIAIKPIFNCKEA